MRNNINISNGDKSFNYLLEYKNFNDLGNGNQIRWFSIGDDIYLQEDYIDYYRVKNEWYNVSGINFNYSDVPENTEISKIKVFFPNHSLDNYVGNVKYMLTANTWVNGRKIELGSYLFRRIDALACVDGVSEKGNDRYYDYIEFEILDPYNIIYSDEWTDFRHNVCGEPLGINNTGSIIKVTLYVVEEHDGRYVVKDECVGGSTAFNIYKSHSDYMTLQLEPALGQNGWKFKTNLPQNFGTDDDQRDWFETYLSETYYVDTTKITSMTYELVAKNSNTLLVGPCFEFEELEQVLPWTAVTDEDDTITENDVIISNPRAGLKHFFSSWEDTNDGWPHYEAGWSLQGSLTILFEDGEEINLMSNLVPITQEIFKYYVGNRENQEYIDIMEINNYTLVNKIENKIIQLDRPNDSKSNIIQPVFFRVKDTKTLNIHPAVNENVCIDLSDYKSKVESFKIQMEGVKFKQIGANQYGIIFKIIGTQLPQKITSGTYYILNEDDELVTTGKYNYVV
jgi:hypothetical protein